MSNTVPGCTCGQLARSANPGQVETCARCRAGVKKAIETCPIHRIVHDAGVPCMGCIYGWPASDVKASVDATKKDTGKDRWDLLPIGPVRTVVRVLTWSTGEYPEGNWQHVERPRDRYYAATMRHLTAWFDGEAKDPDSGMPHLAHAVCSLLFLLWFEARELERLGVKP